MTRLTRRAVLKVSTLGFGLLAVPLTGGFGSQWGQARAALGPEDAEAVRRAERYLNGIKSMRARFVQISSNGAYAEGEVMIKRPGRMRFEYDPPHPVLLIADGTNLLYYDKDLKQASFIPLWETPLWFLIRKQVTLTGDVQVSGLTQGEGALRMTLQESGGGNSGTVTLVFSDHPFALRKWEVTDAQGITTQVALVNPDFSARLDNDMFDYGELDVHGLRGGRERP